MLIDTVILRKTVLLYIRNVNIHSIRVFFTNTNNSDITKHANLFIRLVNEKPEKKVDPKVIVFFSQ